MMLVSMYTLGFIRGSSTCHSHIVLAWPRIVKLGGCHEILAGRTGSEGVRCTPYAFEFTSETKLRGSALKIQNRLPCGEGRGGCGSDSQDNASWRHYKRVSTRIGNDMKACGAHPTGFNPRARRPCYGGIIHHPLSIINPDHSHSMVAGGLLE